MARRIVMTLWMPMISGGKTIHPANERLTLFKDVSPKFSEPLMHKRIFVCLSLVFFAAFIGPFSTCSAGSALIIEPEKQFQFAESCFSKKEYLRAVGEYERYIYFFPEGDKVSTAMYKIGMAYFLSDRFKDAIVSFKKVLEKLPKTDIYVKAYFMIGECHVKQQAFGQAIIHFQNLIAITEDNEVLDQANYTIGWVYVEMAEWENARHHFDKISPKNKNRYRLEKLRTELDSGRLLKKKSPRTAGLLSLLPGAGYAYCERYHDALIAFLLNGGLIWAAYESFDQGLYALGGVITFVEFGFYAGNIHGSITSAHKYNRTKTDRFIEHLKQNAKINISAGYKSKRISLSFQCQF
jgi:tetratricopeptide (TPR) repeat protein